MRTRLRAGLLALALSGVPGAAWAQDRAPDAPPVARVRAELDALFAAMAAAVGRGDRAALERLYAPEYVYIHGTGYVNDRATHIAEQLAGDSATRAAFAAMAARGDHAGGPPSELYVYGDGEGTVAVRRQRLPRPAGRRPVWLVTTYVRRGGQWQFAQAQSTVLQPERTPVAVADALLDAYAGEYEAPGRGRLVLRREGSGLVLVRGVDVPFPRPLTPVADTTFYDKFGIAFTFGRGPDGRATHLTTRWETDPPFRYERRP